MRKNILRVCAFLTGLALLLTIAGRVYYPRDNDQDNGILGMKANGFWAYGREELDVVFIGSSLYYAAVDPLQIWEETGITSYNVSTSAQRCYHTDLFLHRVLQRLEPKVIMLDAYAVIREGYPDEALFTSLSWQFPILQYHGNWKRYDLSRILSEPEYTKRIHKKGYRPFTDTVPITWEGFMTPSEEKAPIPLMNLGYLYHMAAVCRSRGVELALMVPPTPYNWSYPIHNALQAEADRLGIPLYDLNLSVEELGIDPAADYKDEGDHLNVKGAWKVNHWLGALLTQDYGLCGHKGEEAFALWEKEWSKYHTEVS